MSNLRCGICGEWNCVCGNPVPAKNGYETTLIVCSKYGSDISFLPIIATVDISKAAYDNLGKLIQDIRDKNYKNYEKHKKSLDKYYELRNSLESFASDRYDSIDAMKISYTKLLQLERKLEEELPHIYYRNGNYIDFTDDYGDLLLITDISTVFDAIMKDNEIYEEKNHSTYRRFDIALSMLQGFNKADWQGELLVVLWGH